MGTAALSPPSIQGTEDNIANGGEQAHFDRSAASDRRRSSSLDRTHHSLRAVQRSYIAVNIIIALLAAGSYWLLDVSIASERSTAAQLYVSAGQEMHTQRIALLSLSLVSSRSPDLRQRFREELREHCSSLEQLHQSFLQGDTKRHLPAVFSKETAVLFFQPPAEFDRKLVSFVDETRRLAALPDAALTIENPHLRTVTSLSTALLSLLSEVKLQLGRERLAAVERLQQLQIVLLVSQLVALLVSGLLFFRPTYLGLHREINRRHFVQRKLALAASRLRKRSAELKRSNQDLEHFAAVIAHDIRAPLHNITIFGELLKTRLSRSPELKLEVEIDLLQDTARGMERMISGLLAYSRVAGRHTRFEAVDLNAVLTEVLGVLAPQIEEAHAELDIGCLPKIEADPVQMKQLFQNLLQNALKFHAPERPPAVSLRAEQCPGEPGNVRLIVRDQGVGFDAAQAERIFDIFARAHNDKQFTGTGIGLAVCKRVVLQHGGTIIANSTPGRGAEFTITLPLQHCQPLNGTGHKALQ